MLLVPVEYLESYDCFKVGRLSATAAFITLKTLMIRATGYLLFGIPRPSLNGPDVLCIDSNSYGSGKPR